MACQPTPLSVFFEYDPNDIARDMVDLWRNGVRDPAVSGRRLKELYPGGVSRDLFNEAAKIAFDSLTLEEKWAAYEGATYVD